MTDDRAILTAAERAFLAARRVAHLATADAAGVPHVVPVCYAVDDTGGGATLYITIDQKPKGRAPLKRQRNIAENPYVAVVVDRWDEDWTRLGWVMLRGRVDILADGAEHDAAQALLRTRYPQLQAMHLSDLPVIALRIAAVAYWGDLTPA
jgi:PPOX class probable F420-dependent enzyme